MPLVIFNYESKPHNPLNSKVIDFKQTVEIPRESLNKRWKLVAVNALYFDNANENFQMLEIEIPELLHSNNVLYACEGVGVEPPKESMRFYVKHNQLATNGIVRELSCESVISEYPNIDLGVHSGENEHLTLIINALQGHANTIPCRLRSSSIILEYEE